MAKKPKKLIGYFQSALVDHPDYVNAIGMISIENGNLEMALADLLGVTLHIRVDIARAVYFTPRAAFLRIDILDAAAQSALRPKRGGDRFYENEPAKAAALKAISEVVSKARSVVGRRHAVIHDAWGLSDETGKVQRYTLPVQEEAGRTEDISTLRSLIRDFRDVITQAKSLAIEFRRKPPTMVDLREGPPDKTPK
jgi:hypothetical protein